MDIVAAQGVCRKAIMHMLKSKWRNDFSEESTLAPQTNKSGKPILNLSAFQW